MIKATCDFCGQIDAEKVKIHGERQDLNLKYSPNVKHVFFEGEICCICRTNIFQKVQDVINGSVKVQY
jgi:hypothetical protein